MKELLILILLCSGFCTSYAQNISTSEKIRIIAKTKELLTEHFISVDIKRTEGYPVLWVLMTDAFKNAAVFPEINWRGYFRHW